MVQPGKMRKMLLFHQEQPKVADLRDGGGLEKAAFYNTKLMRVFSCKSNFFIKTVIEKGHAVQEVQCFIYVIGIPQRV